MFVVQTHMPLIRIKSKHSVIEMHRTIAEIRYYLYKLPNLTPDPKQKFDEVASVISVG